MKKIVYMCGQGFTACCSSVLFNNPGSKKFVHPTLEEHLASRFYKKIRASTFLELFEENKIPRKGLLPCHSSPCTLCEYLFEATRGTCY